MSSLTSPGPEVPAREVVFSPLRARGPGGQHVNTSATGVQLRFDVRASSLPQEVKQRLLALPDRRIGHDGVIVIRADRHRSQALNKAEALRRLAQLLEQARQTPRRRIRTRPSRAARQRRLEEKQHRARTKRLRGRVRDFD